MPITLELQHHIQARAEPTPRALEIAVMFGLSLDGTHEQVIIPPVEITLSPGQIVFITGVSGGGKSTLLRLLGQALLSKAEGEVDTSAPSLVWSDRLPALPDLALVDALAQPAVEQSTQAEPAALDRVCHWLSQAGLNDAAVMLRRPNELSEGQRHRLRLAQAIAVAQRAAQ